LWNALNFGLLVQQIAIDPTTPQTVYGGTSWNTANTGLTNRNVYSIAITPLSPPSFPQTIYAGTDAGVFKSDNGGTSWSSANTGLTNSEISSIAIPPSTPQIVYAGTNNGGVFVSDNGGLSWVAINTGLINTNKYGGTSTCNVTPATGYQVATFTDNSVDKTGAVNSGGYSITGVTTDNTIAATFSLIPPTPVSGACGTSNNGTFTVVPTTNFCTIGTATVVTGTGPWGWACIGSNGGTTATCLASIQTYTISANVTGGNGTVSCISPVNSGATSTCTVTPASGYQLATFTDNSADKIGSVAGGGYGIANVAANHSIAATFSQIPPTPTPVNGACGTSNSGIFAIIPTTNLCNSGTATAVTGTGPWSWNGTGTNGGTTATCNASIQTYTILANVTGSNGTVSCTSPVNNGATATCTVSPASGYQMATFTDNSIDKIGTVAVGGYSIANVTANHSVVATFSQIPPTPVMAGYCKSY
jgi:hypothetical protein